MPDSVTMMNRFRRIRFAEGNHLFRRADRVRQIAHLAQAFRMNHDFRVRKLLAQFQQLLAPELDVRVTIALPQRHRAARLFHHPLAEIFVRHEQHILSFGAAWTIFTALPLVQITSLNAFTAALQLM